MSADEFAPALGDGTEEYAEVSAPPCRDCGPGYRIGGDGCRHGDGYQPEIGETGICRTCALPIWWEWGEIGGRKVVGWSDRITQGGDSVVCFKAVGYRHVPMGGREAAIYRLAKRDGAQAVLDAVEAAMGLPADTPFRAKTAMVTAAREAARNAGAR